MSIHLMSFMGTSPFGSLWGGAVANHLGAPVAVLCGGILCLLAALAFATQVRKMQSHAH